ncbi:helix-turn-helix transcriptional regulator [Streptococcus uberis]|uniref:helix-turn-helix transcriptional regulator n=1 Tax=Streptococcus uberis TaxID=1349 RepID=UPI001FF3707A|nr:helix-turn-helix transcriptional regulator [Streptococcus uberis]MCK1219565.1 helix-turn-helix transcriptional regulator [Streptococcus uberis]
MQVLLYELRKKAKLGQKDLAEVIHLSTTQYGKKERGESAFTQDEMFELSKFFNKPLSEIFFTKKVTKMETW